MSESSNCREELLLAYPRNANDASQRPFRQRLRTVNRDDNGVLNSRLYQHVVTTFDPVQSKSKSFQRSNSLLARDRWVGGHQAMPTMRLSSVSFAALRGIRFPFDTIDLM